MTSIEQRAGVVRAHVGVGLGDALSLSRDVTEGAFQTSQFARVLDSFYGSDRRFKDGDGSRARMIRFHSRMTPTHYIHIVLDRSRGR